MRHNRYTNLPSDTTYTYLPPETTETHHLITNTTQIHQLFHQTHRDVSPSTRHHQRYTNILPDIKQIYQPSTRHRNRYTNLPPETRYPYLQPTPFRYTNLPPDTTIVLSTSHETQQIHHSSTRNQIHQHSIRNHGDTLSGNTYLKPHRYINLQLDTTNTPFFPPDISTFYLIPPEINQHTTIQNRYTNVPPVTR